MSRSLVASFLILATFAYVQPTMATTGWGCFSVINTGTEALELHSEPDPNSEITARIQPNQHGVIAEDGSCLPADKPPSQQWCPIEHIGSRGTDKGYARLRYLAPSECP
jgi:hypothetical protein